MLWHCWLGWLEAHLKVIVSLLTMDAGFRGVRRISFREGLEHMASGGLGRSPQRGPGAEPLVGSQGGKAPWSWSWKLFVVCCPKEVAKIGPFLTTHLDLQGARVYFRLFGVSKMTAKLTSLHRIWPVCTATTWCSEGDWSILHKTREDP